MEHLLLGACAMSAAAACLTSSQVMLTLPAWDHTSKNHRGDLRAHPGAFKQTRSLLDFRTKHGMPSYKAKLLQTLRKVCKHRFENPPFTLLNVVTSKGFPTDSHQIISSPTTSRKGFSTVAWTRNSTGQEFRMLSLAGGYVEWYRLNISSHLSEPWAPSSVKQKDSEQMLSGSLLVWNIIISLPYRIDYLISLLSFHVKLLITRILFWN